MVADGGAPTNVVILNNIPDGISEEQISAAVSSFATVLKVDFQPADLDGPGWAFLALGTPELAKLARERLHGKPLLGGGTVAVQAALGEGLFGDIRSLEDPNSPWKEARSPQGQVYYYHAVTLQTSWIKPPPELPPQPPGSSGRPPAPPPAPAAARGGSSTGASADAGLRKNADGSIATSGSGPVGANLFIYHIPNSWDDNILKQHFEHFGNIKSCRVQTDDSGRPRGFGFVSYDAPEAAKSAIAGMHGFPVEGKFLKVQLKKGDEQQMAPNVPAPPGAVLTSATPAPPAPPPAMPPPPPPQAPSTFAPLRPPPPLMPPSAPY
mmetsp:Transcript_32158/g.75519  ORF Transcript_32158/g.75519 Transcript_32158/m.75519 type:complete len:323 (+) Transcript_32158:61-1029(+)